MKVDNEGRTLCDGTGCESLAVDKLNELVEVPHWRRPVDYPDRFRAYETHQTVNFCQNHKEVALKQAQVLRDREA